jgi:archaellum component FlaC
MATNFTQSAEDYAYRTYIKDIYLELPDYKHIHSSLHGNSDEVFVGRDENSKKIEDTLNSSEHNGNGAYLVTGYRGMGKTSLVNSVINRYKIGKISESILIRRINVNFSQSNLDEAGILKQMIQNIVRDIERNPLIRFSTVATIKNICLVVTYIFFVALFFNVKSLNEIRNITIDKLEWRQAIMLTIAISTISFSIIFFKRLTFWILRWVISIPSMSKSYVSYVYNLIRNHFLRKRKYLVITVPLSILMEFVVVKYYLPTHCNQPSNTSIAIFYFTFPMFVNFLFFIRIFRVLKYFYEMVIMEKKIYDTLTELLERCNASITSEVGIQNSGESLMLGFIDKRTKAYPIANSKEIENEIIHVLKVYNKFKLYKKKYIVVFDELDKIEANGNTTNEDDKTTQQSDDSSQKEIIELGMRKKVILNILSSLKYFTTEAKARFIFIAGREMFDASLADIADRQSSISSIFHQTIYLDSFLKDKGSTGMARGLTNLVEEFLQKILLPDEFISKIAKPTTDAKLKVSSSFIKKYYNYLESRQQNTTQQNLKIIYNIQNFIIYLTYRSNGSPKKLVKIVEEYIHGISSEEMEAPGNKYKTLLVRREKNPTNLYIRFSYKSQYKFAFIAYLYRPFILNYSPFVKQYSDNVLVSTPFLMDHIIKFHPFAFSLQNLELLPEVISNNKNPILRYFIEELIGFLGENHIRETDIGLFEYKFINKTADEILYLSKIFEAESAAFNFTLNETDLVKNYIQGKIREAIKNNNTVNGGSNNGTDPRMFLYNLLGDAYYFDQEFDNAIISYQSGLAWLNAPSSKFLDYKGFIMWLQYKMKLGLVYEKMKSYELALGIYNDSISDTLTYFKDVNTVLERRQGTEGIEQGRELFGALNSLLQTVIQPLLSSMYLVEKHSVNGFRITDLEHYIQVYRSLIKYARKDDEQLPRVTANYLNNIGNLLYYKNFKSETATIDSESRSQAYSTKIKELVYCTFEEYAVQVEQDEPRKYPLYEPQLIQETNEVEKWIENNYGHHDKFNKDFRFSFHAFVTYKNALSCFVSSIPGLSSKSRTLSEMFFHCAAINFNFQNRYDKSYLKGIAGSISNIANQLYSILNTKGGKFPASTVLKDAAVDWHSRLDGLREGYETVRKSYALLSLKRNNTSDKKSTQAYQALKDGLGKINENWYTHDQLGQDILHLSKSQIQLNGEHWKEYIYKVGKVLEKLTEKIIKDRFKHGILAFWDKYIYEYFEKYNDGDNTENSADLDLILILYYLSGRFYSRAGKSFSFSFQLKKILHVIKSTVEIKPVKKGQEDAGQNNFLSLIENTFLFQILEITSWVSNSTDRPQIYKYKDAQNIDTIYHPPHFAKYNYFNTSNASAIKEAIYVFASIRLNSIDFSEHTFVSDCAAAIPEFSLTSPYNIISTQYSRILELDLQEKMNRAILKSFLFGNILSQSVRGAFNYKGTSGNDSTDAVFLWERILFNPYKRYGVIVEPNGDKPADPDFKKRFEIEGGNYSKLEEDIEIALWKIVDMIENDCSNCRVHFTDYQKVVANSIYSLRQIIASIRIQGPNYYISYSHLAYYHLKLGTWYKHYALCRSILRRLKDFYKRTEFNVIDRYIKDLLGSDGIITLDSTSQYQIALQYYHKAKQMHSNGTEYERAFKNLIYLEDDFNDNLYHFGIALERQRLNSYHIRSEIKRLENELKDSPLYRYDSFVESTDKLIHSERK